MPIWLRNTVDGSVRSMEPKLEAVPSPYQILHCSCVSLMNKINWPIIQETSMNAG